MSSVLLKAAKETSRRRNCRGLYKKQKRQEWVYHDAPSAIYCAVAQ